MIHNEEEYKTTLERISYFQKQASYLRRMETNPENYRMSVAGFLAELDRMNLELRDYFWTHPSQLTESLKIA
ncbi:MAG: hypothetical protein U9R17_16355 [Thermodesulfobacteriota bacterium]|nr:hypothetical protein [Thermodesulfobacteriota bacterium]